MGNGMNKILPGLYIGNFRDSREEEQLKTNKITHILSIHDHAKPHRSDMIYLCISARDAGTEDLSQHFSACNDFIHSARIYGGNVLVHCLAGMSRSVTVAVAYIMTTTNLGWRDALNVVRVNRQCASPNFGFQKQLLAFQHEGVAQERSRLFKKYPKNPHLESDLEEVQNLMRVHKEWVLNGDIADKETYPLPHNAYTKDQAQSETSANSNNKSKICSIGDNTESSCPLKGSSSDRSELVEEMFSSRGVKSELNLRGPSVVQFEDVANGITDCKTICSNVSSTVNVNSHHSPNANQFESANRVPSSSQVSVDDLFADTGRKKDSPLSIKGETSS